MAILTQEGLDKFKKEKEILIEKRKGAVANLTRAREMGDLSENGFYKAARHELSEIDRRVRELTYILKGAQIIRKGNHGFVTLGNSVKVLIDGKEIIYQIVGKYEANPKEGKISNESPVGQGLLGKSVEDSLSISMDGKNINYKILDIK